MEQPYARHFIQWFVLLIISVNVSSQATNCSNAYTLSLDGSCRNFPVSSTTGSCIFCTMSGYSGNNGHVTFFQFTTNLSSECVLIDISTKYPVAMEMVLYNSCIAGAPLPLGGDYYHNMCMTEGTGLWAQNLFNNLLPNTTYYLRVRTAGGYTDDLQVCATYYTPPNNDCSGATALSPAPVLDNNACHNPSFLVQPPELCATTLENTAWYTYIIQVDGSSTITIDSISCSNGNGDNINGFQIGFFKGNCSGLSPITCSNGIGGKVEATADGLTAGTRIFVGIDGYSGSNCRYLISASNAGLLPVTLKNFFAWKFPDKNVLKWVTTQESNNAYFEIQRSDNGSDFYPLGKLEGYAQSFTDKQYSFDDLSPLYHSYYRLKQVDMDGKFSYSQIIDIQRDNIRTLKILPVPPADNLLKMTIESSEKKRLVLNLIDMSGKIILTESVTCNKGITIIQKRIERFLPGKYVISLRNENDFVSRSFIKTGIR